MTTETNRTCRYCGCEKPIRDFTWSERDGYSLRCKACYNDLMIAKRCVNRKPHKPSWKRGLRFAPTTIARCKVYGKEKEFLLSRLGKYCSQGCSAIALRNPDVWKPHNCPTCGKPIDSIGGHYRKYCSQKCSGKAKQKENARWRDPKQIKAYMKQYSKRRLKTEHRREMVNAQSHNRRAALRGCGGTHTAAEWIELKATYNNCCAYCGKKLKRATKDHLIPLAKKGNNCIGNIIPACGTCNRSKSDKYILDWPKFNSLQLPLK